MNAPVNSQTCGAETSYCEFGCEAIVDLLDGFEESIDGVIENEDIECVHKTRVTSRKIRAALPLFQPCFSSKKYKRWTKEIKKVTRLLGEARDLDVQIDFVKKYLKNVNSAEKKCVNKLLCDRVGKRDGIQPLVTYGINKLKASDVLEDMGAFCKNAIEGKSNVRFDPNQVLKKAQWHICFRLDDFLSLEKYVHVEDANEKHHEMRIHAKKLRYTMEFFAPLYKNKLKNEIETIKAYQDILGEKHDLEVWINYLPKFIEESKEKSNKKLDSTKFEQALENFLAYIKDQRKDHYRRFVQLWEDNLKQNFFEQLKETTKAGLTMSKEKTNQILANPDVKVAVLSDVHANLQALEAVIRDAEDRGADVFLNAGDAIGFGAFPNEVVELLSEKNVVSVLGNYDLEVIEGKADVRGEKKVAYKFTQKELAKTCQSYLCSLPRELRLQIAGVKLLVTHGSPESIDEHITHDTIVERLKNLAGTAGADVIIVGHSHEQLWRNVDGVSFINPGSVGRPSDANPQAAYAILTFNPFKVEMIRLDYDVEAAAGALRKKSLPESFAQMLLQGVSLDAIIKEDNAKEKNALENCKVKVDASKDFAKGYGQDLKHCRQVTDLTLDFFDGLVKLHNLGEKERCWLECAAIMHDAGLLEGRRGHHKETATLILNNTQLPFSSRERRIVASVARYHRKGLPKQKHYNLRALDGETIKVIKVLSSLLRVADSLDYTHQSNVKSLNFKVGTKKIIAECQSETKSTLEEQAFNKKKDLFERLFAKKLVLIWKKP
ncbi:MAG: YfcE family phosphodiesterase [Candidatus Bathyarchaeia archaeon]|jgi:putative phosphoesterase